MKLFIVKQEMTIESPTSMNQKKVFPGEVFAFDNPWDCYHPVGVDRDNPNILKEYWEELIYG